MCGIVGAVGLSGRIDPMVETAVLGALEHRGPDAVGTWSSGDTWFGFRRLSIQDLRAVADQPMSDVASGVTIAFNGEIYNFVELRRELEAAGHVFLTEGDTEVLLRGYLEWGTGVLPRCNGMWAVAIFDPARSGVLLARDRFGEKPLHFGRDATGAWWFASEVRPLVTAGVGGKRLRLERALGFLLLGDVEDPTASYVEGIEQVAPGTHLRLTVDGPREVTTWFDLGSFVAAAWGEPGRSDDEVLALMDRAIELRLRADVEVGTSLSGGVDSSAVVAGIRAVAPSREVHAFTSSFPGRSIDEFDRAKTVADRYGFVLHRVEPTPTGFLGDLDLLLERQGAPIEGPTVYAQWCVMRRARAEGVTVLLDGQGADETWGGYPKHAGFAVVGEITSGHPLRAAATVRRWRSLGAPPRVPLVQALALVLPESMRDRSRALLLRRRRGALGPAMENILLGDPQGRSEGGLLRRGATADLGRVLLPRLLRYADRNSMAASVEVRLPFLDPELAVAGLASDWVGGVRVGWTKHALRRAMENRVPSEVLWRREKVAYEVPESEWLRRPDVMEAVRGAHDGLVNQGILGPSSLTALPPWRVLTLGRFVDRYGLTS